MSYYGLWNLQFNPHLQGLNDTNTPNRPNTPGYVADGSRRLDTTPGGRDNPEGYNITYDAQGRPSFSPGAIIPSLGQWGEYQNRVGDGFTGTRNGINYINGRIAPGWAGNDSSFVQFMDRYSPFFTEGMTPWDRQSSLDAWRDRWVAPTTNPLTRGIGGQRPLTSGIGGEQALDTTDTNDPNIITNPLIGRGPFENRPNTQLKGGIVNPNTNNPLTNNPINRTPLTSNNNNPISRNPLYPNNNNSVVTPGKPPLGTNSPNTPRQPPRIYPNDPNGQNPNGIRDYNQLLDGRPVYGTFGNRVPGDGLNEQQYNNLPEWLRSQYRRLEDEGGTPFYSLSSGGTIRTQDGREVYQLGNESAAVGEGDGSVINWEEVWYDPELGLVTSPSNIRSVTSDSHRTFRTVVQALIAAGALYVASGYMGLYNTPNGAVLSEETLRNAAFAGSTAGGELSTAIASLPAGTVTGLTQAANGVWQAVIDGAQWVWNNGRWVMSAFNLANNVFGNNNNQQARRNPMGNQNNNPQNVPWWARLASGAINNYNDNENIRDFISRQNELLGQADYNREYRPGYLSRLQQFLTNPEAALDDPTFQAVRNRNLGNLSRRLNSRGYNMSGREMAELQDYGREQDWQQIDRERRSLMDGIRLGNPEQTYSNALRNLPFIYLARGARNFDTSNSVLDGLFGRNGLMNSLINSGGDTVNRFVSWLSGGADLDSLPPNDELLALLTEGANSYGTSVQDYIDEITSNPYMPEIIINSLSDSEWTPWDDDDFWAGFTGDEGDFWDWLGDFFGD